MAGKNSHIFEMRQDPLRLDTSLWIMVTELIKLMYLSEYISFLGMDLAMQESCM